MEINLKPGWLQRDIARAAAAIKRWRERPPSDIVDKLYIIQQQIKDERTISPPSPGSVWRHRNGIYYTVLFLANAIDSQKYPLTVVYIGPNGKVWTRLASDWHRSFTHD